MIFNTECDLLRSVTGFNRVAYGAEGMKGRHEWFETEMFLKVSKVKGRKGKTDTSLILFAMQYYPWVVLVMTKEVKSF